MNEGIMDKAAELMLNLCETLSGWESSVAKLGRLSVPQLKALCVIGRHRDVRMKDVADRLKLTTGTVTVMIDRLQSMGLVKRIRSEMDRLSYQLALTEQGQAVFNEHDRRQNDMLRRLFARMEPEDLDGFMRGARALLRAL